MIQLYFFNIENPKMELPTILSAIVIAVIFTKKSISQAAVDTDDVVDSTSNPDSSDNSEKSAHSTDCLPSSESFRHV